jgi:hypothetical protein
MHMKRSEVVGLLREYMTLIEWLIGLKALAYLGIFKRRL